jgi:GntR family transcriptional regulator
MSHREKAMLDHGEPTPLYEQIRRHLVEEFRSNSKSGQTPFGDALLMRRFNVSRTTVRTAISELARHGLVKRIPGRGTFFLKEPRLEIGVDSIERLLQEWYSLGFDADAKVLTFKYVKAPPEIASKLKVSQGSKVLLVRRVRVKAGKHASLDTRYTAEWCAHVIKKEDATNLLLPVIEKRLGIKAVASEQEIWAQGADQVTAKALRIRVGAPVLSREATLIAEGERPISTGPAFYRADLFRFRMRVPGEAHRLELHA